MPAGKVEVAVDEDDVKISGGRSQFSVRPLSLDDYPRVPTPASSAVTLDAAAFGEALRQVVRAASTDEARPILTGVLLTAENDGLRLVATDSYRLAVRDLPGVSVLGADQKVLVPGRALAELQRLLGAGGELTLRLGERDATFELGTTRLTTRLIEGEFPNYRQLIPQSHPNTLTVDRVALLEAIRRVKILARDATPVRLQIAADGLKLTAITQDVGNATEELDATAIGHRPDGRVQPGLPRRRRRGARRRADHAVDDRRPEAGRRPRRRQPGLPVPADARAGAVTRCRTTSTRVTLV